MTRTRPPERPANIHDVAREAGVSRQTVTRAMNDMTGINARTKERVLAVAQELRYRPSRFGRGLVKNDQRTIGLVVDDLANPYYPELASAVIGAAAGRGWNVVVAERRHTSDQQRLLDDLAGQVDAVIGYLGSLSRSSTVELTGLPVVDIDPQQIVAGHGRVHLDMRPAVIETVRHLIGEGVARPVMVDVSAKSVRSGRTELFAERLAEHRVELPVVFAGESSVQAGAAATQEVLRRRRNVDVILCFNDIMACGVLKGLRGRQIEVPERVRVIGIDGLQIGSFVTPQLTSLALNFEQIARAAVELVIKLGQGAVDSALERTVAHRLVVRESG